MRKAYGDAYLAAHFEVPGEMFRLAMEAKTRGMGVVGSTSNILAFITEKVADGKAAGFAQRLQFVLGTEAGMVTSIVREVKALLCDDSVGIEVEIVFPVSSQSIAVLEREGSPSMLGLPVVPGPASGEGCGPDGGCAACPYMKMNTLAALRGLLQKVGTAGEVVLEGFKPKAYSERLEGRSVAQVGCKPILHMREFGKEGKLGKALVRDVVERGQ